MNNPQRFTPCARALVLACLCAMPLAWAGPAALCEQVAGAKVIKMPSSITVRTVAAKALEPGVQLLGLKGERVSVGSLSNAHSYAFEDDLRRHWTHRVDWSVFGETDAVDVSQKTVADEAVRLFFDKDAQGTERLCRLEMPESRVDWQFLHSLDPNLHPTLDRQPAQQAPRWVLRFAYGTSSQLIGVRTSKISRQAAAPLVQATCIQRDPLSGRVQSITSTVGKDCNGNVKDGVAFRQVHVHDAQGHLLRIISDRSQPRVMVYEADGAVKAAYFTNHQQQRPFRVAVTQPPSCAITKLLERAPFLDRLVVIGGVAKPFTWKEFGGFAVGSQPWEIYEYSPQGATVEQIASGATGQDATVRLSAPLHAALYDALSKHDKCVALKTGMGVNVDFLLETPDAVWRACTDISNTSASACP